MHKGKEKRKKESLTKYITGKWNLEKQVWGRKEETKRRQALRNKNKSSNHTLASTTAKGKVINEDDKRKHIYI